MSAKPIVDLYDSNIWKPPPFLEFENYIFSTSREKSSSIALVTDRWLRKVPEIKKKGYKAIIGCIFEPRAIYPNCYSYVEKNIGLFDLVLTYDKLLLDKFPGKCKFIHAFGGKFYLAPGLHEKSKLCSIIFSKKKQTKGQKLRHEVFQRFSNYFDGYKGPDTPFTECKSPVLNDFCYSVVIENSQQAHYFTEKITECFLAGTVPIYWGCPTISKFFDTEGIITFNDLNELEPILKNLSFEDYQRRLPAIRRNYETVKKYDPVPFEELWNWIKLYI